MQETSLFMEGVNLLTLGMGFVFIFLVFLVLITSLMSKFVTRFLVKPKLEIAKNNKINTNNNLSSQDPINQPEQLIAVLTAAIRHHRTNGQVNL